MRKGWPGAGRIPPAIAALALAAAASPIGATHSVLEHVSQGAVNGNGVPSATFAGVSADGSHVFFHTSEALAATDTDTIADLYDRTAGQTLHVSQGLINGNGLMGVTYLGSSADGSRVFFLTSEPLVAGDTDTRLDIYERFQGTTSQVSEGNGPVDPEYLGASADGTRVFFRTTESLLVGDGETRADIYARIDGALVLVTDARQPGAFREDALFRGITPDGRHVFFDTFEEVLASDDETGGAALDVYEWFDGQTFHVSIGSNVLSSATFVGAAADGSHVFFATNMGLDSVNDTDGTTDVYDRFAGGTFLVSRGALPGTGTQGVTFVDASADGTRVIFSTSEALAATDADTAQDLYERADDQTLHVTQGVINGNGNMPCFFAGASQDGARIFFTTTERLAVTDGDAAIDVYERAGGATAHVSRGEVNGNGAFNATFRAVSTDGSRVFFETSEALAGQDADVSVDVYEHAGGLISKVSPGSGAFGVTFGGATPDGGRVFFTTGERLADTDADESVDLYAASVLEGPPDHIFGDGFESGDLGAWDATATDGGNLDVSPLAALGGTSVGLQGLVDDTAGLYVQDDTPGDETRYRARFYFDTNGFDPGEGLGRRRTRLFLAFEEAPNRRLAAVVLRRLEGEYAVMGRCRLDDGSQADTGFVAITDEPHVVEVDWQRATGPDALDGSFQLWIDGIPAATLSGLDNGLGGVDFARLGALSVKAGAAGTLRWDEFESRRESYIGP